MQEERKEKRNEPKENIITEMLKKETEIQSTILQALLEFKFEYLENVERDRIEGKEREEPIDYKEEFRAIHSENLMTIKRIMSDVHMEVVHPLLVIQENIERNLIEIPSNTRKIIKEVKSLSKEVEEKGDEEREKLDNIIKLSTLNLIQAGDNKKDMIEVRTNIDELKSTVKEINQRVIEYGLYQKEIKDKEIKKDEKKVKKEKETNSEQIKLPKYKFKKSSSESSSSSSSSDDEGFEKENIYKEKLKKRTLERPNLVANILDTDFIKKALLETENGGKFGELLEEKWYEFTIVHDMEERHGDEDIFEIMKEY